MPGEITRHIHVMLYGDKLTPSHGHWVLLRRYHIGEFSKYWDAGGKEAISGPKWKYDDYVMRTTYEIGNSFTSSLAGNLLKEGAKIAGQVDFDARIYIVERCFRPREGDHILEYRCDLPSDPDAFIALAKVTGRRKFKIINVEEIRPDGNFIEYYLCATKIDHQRN